VNPVRVAAAAVDIAVPLRSGGVAGVDMAGFRGRSDGIVNLQVVPYPAFTVFIDIDDELLIDHAGERRRGSVVFGLAPGNVRAGCRGQAVDCLQVRLSPVVAHTVLGASPELAGTVVAFEDLWGHDAVRIQERLRAAESWEDRFAIAGAAFARRCVTTRAADPEVAFAWGQIVTRRGRVRVARLAADIGWSRKRLWSRFQSQIGLTPARAAKLVRFDHAAHRLAAGHRAALVAAEGGYADQSHLCRDVMAFAGLTPTAVASAPWLAVDDVAWPARKQATV
jgi:AraC-like DNA-binding protein